MALTKEDIIRLVQEEDIEFIRMQFVDIFAKSFQVTSLVIVQRKFSTLLKLRLQSWYRIRMLRSWQEQLWKMQD